MSAMVYVERLFRRLRVRLMPGQDGLGLGMMRSMRLEMDGSVVPGIFMLASFVLAFPLRGQVPGRFFPMGMFVFAMHFHTQ